MEIPFFTVRNVVAARYCFHRRLSFCSLGVRECLADPPGRHTPQADTPLGRHPPGRTPLPPSRQLPQRTVCIVLECILVLTLQMQYLSTVTLSSSRKIDLQSPGIFNQSRSRIAISLFAMGSKIIKIFSEQYILYGTQCI